MCSILMYSKTDLYILMENTSEENIKESPYFDCPDMKYVQDTLYVINGKWKLLILLSLRNGHSRYRQIAKSIPNITFRMLSKELKEMEMNKLVARTINEGCPVTIDYSLTDYSKTLWPLLSEMIKWAKDHRKAIQD